MMLEDTTTAQPTRIISNVGVSKGGRPPWAEHKNAAFKHAARQGLNATELAEEFGIDTSTVYYHAKRLGLTLVKGQQGRYKGRLYDYKVSTHLDPKTYSNLLKASSQSGHSLSETVRRIIQANLNLRAPQAEAQ